MYACSNKEDLMNLRGNGDHRRSWSGNREEWSHINTALMYEIIFLKNKTLSALAHKSLPCVILKFPVP